MLANFQCGISGNPLDFRVERLGCPVVNSLGFPVIPGKPPNGLLHDLHFGFQVRDTANALIDLV